MCYVDKLSNVKYTKSLGYWNSVCLRGELRFSIIQSRIIFNIYYISMLFFRYSNVSRGFRGPDILYYAQRQPIELRTELRDPTLNNDTVEPTAEIREAAVLVLLMTRRQM
jgi:hypothetical protein